MVVLKKDVVYDPKNQLKTDIYFPNNTSSKTKILIFWHGGGWFKGKKEDSKDLGIHLANAGFMTLIPDYRLAPAYHFPSAHNDSLTFTKWLLNSSYTDADDIKNIVQIGASAGGTLALYIAGGYGFPTVTWSAPVEFSNWIANHTAVLPKIDNGYKSFYKYFTLNYIGTENIRELSQLDVQNYNLENLGPLKMFNSAKELVELDSVLDFIKFLALKNHEVDLSIIPGTRHAMSYANQYLNSSLDFLYSNTTK